MEFRNKRLDFIIESICNILCIAKRIFAKVIFKYYISILNSFLNNKLEKNIYCSVNSTLSRNFNYFKA